MGKNLILLHTYSPQNTSLLLLFRPEKKEKCQLQIAELLKNEICILHLNAKKNTMI